MNNVLSKPMLDLLNKCEPPMTALLYCVPLRIVRVVGTDETFKVFRVEQLVITGRDPSNPRGSWTTLSTHASETVGGSYPLAVEAAIKAQDDIKRQLMRRAERNKLVRA